MLTALASRARAIAAVLIVAFCLAITAGPLACHPQPPSPSGPPTVVGSWVSTTRTVLTTIRWAVPAAKVVIGAVVSDPGRSVVLRALDGLALAAEGLERSLDIYEARGGDRCAVRAGIGGVTSALVELSRVLAAEGVALGTTFERIADAVGSVADSLAPTCDADAGWSSAGESLGAQLRAVQVSATVRGVLLRHVLDDLQPLDGGSAR